MATNESVVRNFLLEKLGDDVVEGVIVQLRMWRGCNVRDYTDAEITQIATEVSSNHTDSIPLRVDICNGLLALRSGRTAWSSTGSTGSDLQDTLEESSGHGDGQGSYQSAHGEDVQSTNVHDNTSTTTEDSEWLQIASLLPGSASGGTADVVDARLSAGFAGAAITESGSNPTRSIPHSVSEASSSTDPQPTSGAGTTSQGSPQASSVTRSSRATEPGSARTPTTAPAGNTSAGAAGGSASTGPAVAALTANAFQTYATSTIAPPVPWTQDDFSDRILPGESLYDYAQRMQGLGHNDMHRNLNGGLVFRSTYRNDARGSAWEGENLYHGRSGILHDASRPPPGRCFNCGGNHWRRDCPRARR